MTYRKRTRASVRFDPYYKAQWYDGRQLAWRDVQRRFMTIEKAREAFPPGVACRVMEIRMDGRSLVEEA